MSVAPALVFVGLKAKRNPELWAQSLGELTRRTHLMRSSINMILSCRYTVEYFSPDLQTGWIVAAQRVGDTQVTVRQAVNI